MITTLAAATVVMGQSSPVKLTRVKTLDGVKAVALASARTGTRVVVCLETGGVRVMDAAGKAGTVSFTGHKQAAYGAAFSPDGTKVVTGDEQARILLWDAKTGKLIREYPRTKGHTRGIQSISFSPSGSQFVTVGKDDAVCLWNLSGGDPVAKVIGEPANYYGAFMTKSGSVFAGTQAEGLRLLAPKTLKPVAKMKLPGGQGANGFAMNRTGTVGAVCGRDGKVTLYDLTKRTLIAAMAGHTDFVAGAEFTPNGKFLATSSTDGSVRLWDVKTYKSVGQVDNRSYVGSPVAITGSGTYLVTLNASDTVEIHLLSPAQLK